MRRFTCMSIFFAVLMGTALYSQEAQNGKNQMTASLCIPQMLLNRSSDGSASATGIDADVSYIRTGSGGFTFKADLSSGVLLSRSFQHLYAENTPVACGWSASGQLGAGYSFVNNERLQFAVLGTVNLDYMLFSHNLTIVSYAKEGSETVSHSTDQTQSENLLVYGFGLEAFVSFRLSQRLGIFGDLNVSFPDYGTEWMNGTYMGTTYSKDETVRGYVIVRPSAGVSLYF